MYRESVLFQYGIAGEFKVADAAVIVLQTDVVIVVRQGLEGGQAEVTCLVSPHILTMDLTNVTG